MSDKNKEHEFWCASYLGGVCDCSLSEYEDLAEDHGLNGNSSPTLLPVLADGIGPPVLSSMGPMEGLMEWDIEYGDDGLPIRMFWKPSMRPQVKVSKCKGSYQNRYGKRFRCNLKEKHKGWCEFVEGFGPL